MAFTMHSHSGQFCPGHAKDRLEDIIQHAIKIGYKTIGLTEHMPRTDLSDLYPEELLPSPEASLAALRPRHQSYLAEATRLQKKYAPHIHILIGFEGEWIRPASYSPLVKELAADPAVDYFIGSLHHTAGIPIDFDAAMYAQAVAACNKAAASEGEQEEVQEDEERALFERYFDEQHAMLADLRPRVVGHFDLVRLLSAEPARDLRRWAGVWERVARNLRLVAAYGGWLECNTSALRKGLAEPYPKREIAAEWVRLGGRFTMSDDSHGIAQVATNYLRGLDYLEELGVREVWTLERRAPVREGEKAELIENSVTLAEFRATLRLE